MKVYLVVNPNTLIIHGAFSTREKAEKYIDNSKRFVIQEIEVL